MSKLITLYEMYVLIRLAVEERGEAFVYPEEWRQGISGRCSVCVYANDYGTPSCIIGLAMSYRDPKWPTSVSNGAFDDIPGNRDVVTSTAEAFARTVQIMQDRGRPWGMALAIAERYYMEQLQSAGAELLHYNDEEKTEICTELDVPEDLTFGEPQTLEELKKEVEDANPE